MINGFDNIKNNIALNLRNDKNHINKINQIFNNNIINEQVEEPVNQKNFHIELPQEKNNLKEYIHLGFEFEHLSDQKKEKIIHDCILAYQESIQCFEGAIISVCNRHNDAKSFADEMVNRLYTFSKTYHKILIKKNKKLTPFKREIMSRLNALSEFATDGSGTGSVGYNPLAVEKVVKNGTFREKMMLIYTGIYFLQGVDFNEKIVERVNKKIDEFQLNAEIIAKDRAKGKGFIVKHQNVMEFRTNQGRLLKDPSDTQDEKFDIKDIENLTVREMRAMVQDFISENEFNELKSGNQDAKFFQRKVSWIRGRDLFKLNQESDFYRKAVAMGSIPVLTGPSGTADEFLQACDYLNMQDYKDKALVALVGWMGSAGDHSVHEIRLAASWHGIAYPEGPEAFENFYSQDLMQQIESEMIKSNYRLPAYYLSFEYQREVAKQLNNYQI